MVVGRGGVTGRWLYRQGGVTGRWVYRQGGSYGEGGY